MAEGEAEKPRRCIEEDGPADSGSERSSSSGSGSGDAHAPAHTREDSVGHATPPPPASDGPAPVRRRSVTINDAPVTIKVEVEMPPQLLPSSAQSPAPMRSVLKQKEDLKFIIRSADPIGQDTAVYEFNKYQMPILDDDPCSPTSPAAAAAAPLSIRGLRMRAWHAERAFATFIARVSVLLGRSSGRDKAASVVQYGAMFWGAQPFLNVTRIRPGPNAPWTKLEESMSSGRKLFRLGKWLKEYEGARVALTAPDSYLGVLPNRARALLTRALAVCMNVFSFWYYLFDNAIWAAQANLINRSPEEQEIRQQLLEAYPKISYDKYVKLQARHVQARSLRQRADARVDRWKDWKNWASLGRLMFALVHCATQMRSLHDERRRLLARYAERVASARAVRAQQREQHAERQRRVSSSSGSSSSSSTTGVGEMPAAPRPGLDRYDSVGSNLDKLAGRDPEELEAERDDRVREVLEAVSELRQETLANCCNLGILLSRLKFRFFRALPLWIIGALGVTAGVCGCAKNWPKFVAPPKAHKLARRRSGSFDATGAGTGAGKAGTEKPAGGAPAAKLPASSAALETGRWTLEVVRP